jgi:arabinogalactan oligomer/maltooligosaccharide transport system substrate-binding protein
MKKKVLSALLCASMVATMVAGCGNAEVADDSGDVAATEASGTDTSASDTATDPVEALIAATEGTVELRVWAAEEDQDMVNAWCDAFAAQYPDITFNFTVGVESESTAKDTVLTDVEAAADVYSFAGDQLTDLVNAGALQEVLIHTDDVIAACGGEDSGAVQAASKNGTLYAYPATADNGYFMFYNKEYFTEDDVKSLDTMMQIAADNGKQITMQLDSGWYNLSFFLGAGFTLEANEDGSTTCDWNGTSADGIAGTDVVNAMLDIANNDGFVSLTDAEFATGIADGSIIAGVNGTWNATTAQEAWGDNYAATCLPTYTCNGQQIQMSSVAGYKMFGVNPHCENVGWAMLLAEYFTSEDCQLERFELREAGPANVAAAASEEVQSNPAIAALALQSQYAVLDGCEGANYWDPAEAFGAIIAAGNPDGTDPQELLDNLVEGVSQPSAE